MKNWIYIIKNSLCLTFKRKWKQVLSFIFTEIGAIYTFAEIMNCIFNQDLYVFFRLNYPMILVVITLISIALNHERLEISYFIGNTDIKITLKVGDVLTQGSAIIIPTNTTFDTLMEDEFISIKSVQGQFQKKYYPNKLKELDEKIQNSLHSSNIIEVLDDRKKPKTISMK